jgi:hypothetical protein
VKPSQKGVRFLDLNESKKHKARLISMVYTVPHLESKEGNKQIVEHPDQARCRSSKPNYPWLQVGPDATTGRSSALRTKYRFTSAHKSLHYLCSEVNWYNMIFI